MKHIQLYYKILGSYILWDGSGGALISFLSFDPSFFSHPHPDLLVVEAAASLKAVEIVAAGSTPPGWRGGDRE